MLEDNGLVHRELELLTNWWADGALRVQSDSVRRGLLAAAEALGADHIKIGPPGSDSPWDPDRWAGELAALAAEAAEAGARVGLEFLPWTAIKTVHDGMELVESAGHPAAGLIIDVWHTERTHTPAAELATIPLWRIVGVELSDADEQCIGTLFEDSANRRRLCGHGSFDLPGDIRALRAAGWTGPWGVEILSETFRRLNVREAAARAFATAVAQLELATAGTQTGADPSPPAGLGRQITGRPRSEEA